MAYLFATEKERQAHLALSNDLEYFSRKCLKIKTKEGDIEPFVFNAAQCIIHELLEQQLKEKGWVRAIIIKGRQQGCSTYVAARFYWKASLGQGKTVAVISHEQASAQALFDKADMYYRLCPAPMRPGLLTKNSKEMSWDNESDYIVFTAGSKNSGRSRTAQLAHASEIGFYEDIDAVNAGVLQIVAKVPGSEIIKESTGNGKNHLYQDVMDALAGKNGYIVIFIPWFLQPEYREPVPYGFTLEGEEILLKETYGLDNEQIMWRRMKIAELKSIKLFRQEYPNVLEEAFQSSGNAFYDSDAVVRAMNSQIESEAGAWILGVDVARKGGDRTILTLRRGRQIISFTKFNEIDNMQLSGVIAKMIDEWDLDRVFIDYGMGYGVIDRLRERGYGHIVEGIHFGGGASNVEQFANKRAEMAFAFRDWLMDGEVRMPLDADAALDIASMPEPKPNSSGKFVFPPKDQIKKDFGRSPDILDSIMLTFAQPVFDKEAFKIVKKTDRTGYKSELTSINNYKDDY